MVKLSDTVCILLAKVNSQGYFLCVVFKGRLNVRNIAAGSVKRKFHFIWIAKYSSSCLISTIFFCFCLNHLFAGRCGREQELCGCLLSMLLFSVNKVVVKVCLDFGRSVNLLIPSVNVFNKVKENCITVVTRLNTADGNKSTNTRRLQINAASNQKTAFIPASQAKKKKRIK